VPQIIVTADTSSRDGGQAVMFTERVSVRDFESDHFQSQLVERISWAVGDAHELEQQGDEPSAEADDLEHCHDDTELEMVDSRARRERASAAVPAS
jgi:hypothetical protein